MIDDSFVTFISPSSATPGPGGQAMTVYGYPAHRRPVQLLPNFTFNYDIEDTQAGCFFVGKAKEY